MSGDGTRGDEVVQRQRIEGAESATGTLGSLVDCFSRRISGVRIITGGLSLLDVELRLKLLEPFSAGVVDVLSVGDERRRRSVGGRHFLWRTG